MKLYVGCSLLHASEEFRQDIEALKKDLEKDYKVLQFLGLGGGTAEEIYRHDIDCVKSADIFVAECTYPSTGLGIELGTAIADKKPIIALAKEGAKVSGMVLGIDLPNFSFHQYNTKNEAIAIIKKQIAILHNLQ